MLMLIEKKSQTYLIREENQMQYTVIQFIQFIVLMQSMSIYLKNIQVLSRIHNLK